MDVLSSILDNENIEFMHFYKSGVERISAMVTRQIVCGEIENATSYESEYNLADGGDIIIPDREGEVITSIVCQGSGTVEIPMLYKTTVDGSVDILDNHMEFIFGVTLCAVGNINVVVRYSNIKNKENVKSIKIHNTQRFKHNVVFIEKYNNRYLYALKYEV
jgi:hypothetical protein